MISPPSAPNIFEKFGKLSLLALGSASLLMAGATHARDATARNACNTGGSTNPTSFLFSTLVEGDTFQCQDKAYTIGDPAALLAASADGVLTFEWTAFPPQTSPGEFVNDLFSLTVDFVPNLSAGSVVNPSNPVSGSFSYQLDTDFLYALKDVGLDSNVGAVLPTPPNPLPPYNTLVTKEVRRAPFGSSILTLESPNGANTGQVALGSLTTVYVTDTWTVQGGNVIKDFTNTFRQSFTGQPPEGVPGPLPILGAGAAFGFSRRLRRRIRLTNGMGLNRAA